MMMMSATVLIFSLLASTAALNSSRDVTSGTDARHVVRLDDCKIRAGKEAKRVELSPAVTVAFYDARCRAPVANTRVNVTFESEEGFVCRGTAKTDAEGQLELVVARLSKTPLHPPASLRVCIDSTRCANGILSGGQLSGNNRSSSLRICIDQIKADGRRRSVRSVNERPGQSAEETRGPRRSSEDAKRFSAADSDWDKLPMEWIKRGKIREGRRKPDLGHGKYWRTKQTRVTRESSPGEMVKKWKDRDTPGDTRQRQTETDTRDEHVNDGSPVRIIKSGVPELMENVGTHEDSPWGVVSPSNPKGDFTKDTKMKFGSNKKWHNSGMAWIKRDNDKKWDDNVMSWIKKDNDKKWDDNVMSWIKKDNDKKWDDNVMSWIKKDNDKKWDDNVMSWIKKDNDKKWDNSPISWIKKFNKGSTVGSSQSQDNNTQDPKVR